MDSGTLIVLLAVVVGILFVLVGTPFVLYLVKVHEREQARKRAEEAAIRDAEATAKAARDADEKRALAKKEQFDLDQERWRVEYTAREKDRELAEVRREAQYLLDSTTKLLKGIHPLYVDCQAMLLKTKTEYADGAYSIFWESSARTFVLLDQVKESVSQLERNQINYYELTCRHPGLLPRFVYITGWGTGLDFVKIIGIELGELNHTAHRDPDFEAQYGFQRVVEALDRGFSRLDESLKAINRSIKHSSAMLSLDLSTVSDQLAGMRFETQEHQENTARALKEGFRAATGAMYEGNRKAQDQVDAAIREIRKIQYHR